jgi:hypothetical protein
MGTRPAKSGTLGEILDEYTGQNDLESVSSRAELPRGTKADFDQYYRARMRELTGPVPAALSYSEWLKNQTNAFQDEVLGPSRAELFRAGKYELGQFVAPSGRLYTLADLQKLDAAHLPH